LEACTCTVHTAALSAHSTPHTMRS